MLTTEVSSQRAQRSASIRGPERPGSAVTPVIPPTECRMRRDLHRMRGVTDMAAETPPTGMDRAEMKQLLLKSKQEPVNCALSVGDKSVALLMLSRSRSSKPL
jgi:hypothetical protein